MRVQDAEVSSAGSGPDPEPWSPPDDATPERPGRRWKVAAIVVAAILAGIGLRSIAVDGSNSFLVRWLPWLQRTPVTLYYGDADRPVLVPVSRTLPRDATVDDLVAEFLEGPAPDAGLVRLVPAATTLETVTLAEGTLTVSFDGDTAALSDPLTLDSIRRSLTSWDGVDEVGVVVDGESLPAAGVDHLVFFYDETRDMLVGESVATEEPREVLAAFLAGPSASGLVGLPGDVSLIAFDFDASRELLRLNFTFTDSVGRFALDHPQSMRRVLEGLITTMTTDFPQFRGLYLDFEGRATLGLGQCADLLRNLQVTPETLNDERLLARTTS